MLWETIYKDQVAEAAAGETAASRQFSKIINSVTWAQQNFATYPLLLFSFDKFDTTGGSRVHRAQPLDQRPVRVADHA